MKLRVRLALFCAVSFGITSCDDIATPTSTTADSSPLFTATSGLEISRQSMAVILDRFANDLARALGNEAARQQLFQALQGSPHEESKLHLKTLLSDQQPQLASRMATIRGTGVTRSQIVASLDSLIDLELYIPVAEHRSIWSGDADLVVAWALKDDGRIPVGWDLDGQKVQFISADDPPTFPVLALVPAETDFSDASVSDATGAPAAYFEADPDTEGVHMTYAYVLDDHEGFLHGAPEFEVHVRKSAQQTDISCSGEQREATQFNYNADTIWSGDVMIALPSEVMGDTIQYEMWEDDSGPCKNASGRPPKTDDDNLDNRVIDITISAVAVVAAVAPPFSAWGTALAVPNFLRSAWAINEAVQKDDFVGSFVLEDTCYEPAGPSNYELRDDEMVLTGYAKLDFVADDPPERDPICALGAAVMGPSQVTKAGSTGAPTPLYWAELEHPATGVTYEWRDNGVFKTSSSSYTMSPVTVGTHIIQVKVTRTADGATKTVSKTVSVVEGGGCPPTGC